MWQPNCTSIFKEARGSSAVILCDSVLQLQRLLSSDESFFTAFLMPAGCSFQHSSDIRYSSEDIHLSTRPSVFSYSFKRTHKILWAPHGCNPLPVFWHFGVWSLLHGALPGSHRSHCNLLGREIWDTYYQLSTIGFTARQKPASFPSLLILACTLKAEHLAKCMIAQNSKYFYLTFPLS